jgi:ATP-dependent helicase/DNAse subunit B
MGARGATFDVVFLPGLFEKGFPRQIPTGPLLTEPERQVLNELASGLQCGPLPLQRDRPAEERYLFRLALASARRAVVLSYPRIEQHTDRPRVPSRFLVQSCSALVGFGMPAELIDDGQPKGLVKRIPLNRRSWAAEDLPYALDLLEYDRGVFVNSPGAEGREYLSAISDHFTRALELQKLRWQTRSFGPYGGRISDEDLLDHLGSEYGRFDLPISPSRLETYATCPFRYFLQYILGIEELPVPLEDLFLTPLERGALIHDLLRRVYDECLEGRQLGTVSDAEIGDVVQRTREIAEEVGRELAEVRPAIWQAERERAVEEARALLEQDRADRADSIPRVFEEAFDCHRFDLGDGRSVAFRGRIDRIDTCAGGGIRVIDYKTGNASAYREDSFRGGRQLQLPIYLIAACERAGQEPGEAFYLFTREPRAMSEFNMTKLGERMDEFREALGLIVEGISGGSFFPLPAEAASYRSTCGSYCPFRMVCGAARGTIAEMKAADPQAADLRRLREIE